MNDNDDSRPQRRPPNRRRMQAQKSLKGVVFPDSFEDVVSKGLDVRSSLKIRRL